MTDVLNVEELAVEFATSHAPVAAVRGASLSVAAGEIVGLVGESGSGKSTVALAILRLLHPRARITAGRVLVGERDVVVASERELRGLRGRRVSLVPQDPMSALNPGETIGSQLGAAFRAHHGLSRSRARGAAAEALERVHIPDPRGTLRRYPHELSGGQRQRVVIALALSGEPELLIADEATTALDVTTQRQVLTLLAERAAEAGLSVLLITHDLGVVADVCARAYVMQHGLVVEAGDVADVLGRPQHPYTAELLASFPDPARRGEPLGRAAA